MSIKFLVFGGGEYFGFWGGGSADFIFMGARIFLNFGLAIIAFGAFGFILPKYYCCLGKNGQEAV